VTREVIRLRELARAEQLAIDNASLRALVDELTRARDAAKAASRAKSAFLAMMSHELRSPIASVLGYTDLVLDGELAGEDRDNLNRARTSAVALLSKVGDLLTLADLVGGQTQLTTVSFDVRGVVASAVGRLEPGARAKGLRLRLEVDAGVPPTLKGDANKLAQILDHLVGNAVKFTAHGEVTVTVRRGIERAPESLVGLHVSVADTGIGIPPEAQERVFQAFAQADSSSSRRFQGAGLGLAISSALARLLGGALEIDSVVGAGTSVQVTLPFEQGQSLPAASRSDAVKDGNRPLHSQG
jgi:signal transduction histidine kinase